MVSTSASPVRPVSAFGRPGIEVVPFSRRPRRGYLGRRPFPWLDVRTRPEPTPKLDRRFVRIRDWLTELYRQDLPLRDVSMLSADDVIVSRGLVWHRGEPIEGMLARKHVHDPEFLPRLAKTIAARPRRRIAEHPGTSAIIRAPGQPNYFHWTVDVMPRLYMVREIWRDGRIPLDRILLDFERPPRFVSESIEAMLPELLPLLAYDDRALMRLERCLFFVNAAAGQPFRDQRAYTSRWTIATALHAEAVDQRLEGRPIAGGRAILVSRIGASKRPFMGEDLLLTEFADLGLERIVFDELTVVEQMDTMAEARLVIGAHGAGLANLMYCRPGTTVVEITTSDYVRRNLYADIAMYRGLRYGLVVADRASQTESAEVDGVGIELQAPLRPVLREFVSRLLS